MLKTITNQVLYRTNDLILFEMDIDAIQRIENVISVAKTNDNNKFERVIGTVSVLLANNAIKYGENIFGFRHTIDNYFVKHSFNEHGDIEAEKRRGNVAITDDDIKAIPQVLSKPDFSCMVH